MKFRALSYVSTRSLSSGIRVHTLLEMPDSDAKNSDACSVMLRTVLNALGSALTTASNDPNFAIRLCAMGFVSLRGTNG